jgi:hypothetical protein
VPSSRSPRQNRQFCQFSQGESHPLDNFKSVKSVHICHLLFFFLTITTFASHSGYTTSLMKHVSNSLWTSAFAASTFSSDILWSFYFLGLAVRLTCNRCSITSRLTPTKSEVDHAKTSLFLSMNANSSAWSCWLVSAPMHTVLSGTLGFNGTFLNSPSGSMAFLHSVGASALC